MRIRRAITVLLTLTTLFTGGAALTACGTEAASGVSEDSGEDGGDDQNDDQNDGGDDQDD